MSEQLELPLDYHPSEAYHIKLARMLAIAKSGEYTNHWYYDFHKYIAEHGRIPEDINTI